VTRCRRGRRARPARRPPAAGGGAPAPGPPRSAGPICGGRYGARAARRRTRRRARPRAGGTHEPLSDGRSRRQSPLPRSPRGGPRPDQDTPACAEHGRAHVLHQGPDVVGPTPLVGLNEVGVLLRHMRRAQAEPLEARRLDQPTGRITRRVGEDRTGIGSPGLMLPTPADDGGDLGLLRGGVSPGRPRTRPPRRARMGPPTRSGSRSAGGPRRRCHRRRARDRPRCSGAGTRHVRPMAPRVHAHRSRRRSPEHRRPT
jgi:hypothetical protein